MKMPLFLFAAICATFSSLNFCNALETMSASDMKLVTGMACGVCAKHKIGSLCDPNATLASCSDPKNDECDVLLQAAQKHDACKTGASTDDCTPDPAGDVCVKYATGECVMAAPGGFIDRRCDDSGGEFKTGGLRTTAAGTDCK